MRNIVGRHLSKISAQRRVLRTSPQTSLWCSNHHHPTGDMTISILCLCSSTKSTLYTIRMVCTMKKNKGSVSVTCMAMLSMKTWGEGGGNAQTNKMCLNFITLLKV